MKISDISNSIPDSSIYSYYLGEKISLYKKFISPFRKEGIPSLTFFSPCTGVVLWRDWGDYTQSKPQGPIEFVQRMFALSYDDAIQRIKSDFNIGNINKLPIIVCNKSYSIKRDKPKKDIIICPRKFDKNDYSYWIQYGITEDLLNKYDVIPIEKVYIESILLKTYDYIHPIYAYKIKSDNEMFYKIYDPLNENKSKKWLYNGREDMFMGFDELPLNGDLVIMTKSLKDVMCLDVLKYNSFSVQSENYNYTKEFDYKLRKRFDNIVIFFDNDKPGKKFSSLIAKSFNLKNISIPNIYENSKDISDFIKNYGIDQARELMHSLIYNESISGSTNI